MKKGIVAAGVMVLLLTGCAGEVKLSEADSVRVAQYAADLVLKYDNNYKERLLTAEEEKEAEEKLRLAAEKEAALQELLEAKADSSNAEQKKEDDSKTGEKANEAEKEPTVSYNMNDVLKMEGFSFEYAGYTVAEAYPELGENGNDASMEVRAVAGKKLLVTKFNVRNVAEEKAECNLFDKNISGEVVVNGSVKADAMITMLLNDLATLKMEMAPEVLYETVLVFEIPEEAAAVESLELNIKVGENSYNIEI